MDKGEQKTITIPVPDWANWWTVDSDREVKVWEHKPYLDKSDLLWRAIGNERTTRWFIIGWLQQPPKDWTKELHRIE